MSVEAATSLLNKLLAKIERKPLEDRSLPVWEQVPGTQASGEARAAMHGVLTAAERAGAVELRRGRGETTHLVTGVRLASADLLYRHLRRIPAAKIAADIASSLRDELTPLIGNEALEALDELDCGWRRIRHPYGVPPDREETRRFLLALDAVVRRPLDERSDLRTLSSKAGLDSKMVEKQIGRILAWMVAMGRLPVGLSNDEARSTLGLERFAHPVLLAGQVLLRGLPMANLNYVGVAPGDVEALETGQDAEVILTVENFASFNRQVAETMTGREIIVYTGGFPSRATVRALRRLHAAPRLRHRHWGDIDGGGLRIADHLAREVAPNLALHLMTVSLAQEHGVVAKPDPSIVTAGATDEIAALAQFLAGPDALHLEQERIDPVAAVSNAVRPAFSADLS